MNEELEPDKHPEEPDPVHHGDEEATESADLAAKEIPPEEPIAPEPPSDVVAGSDASDEPAEVVETPAVPENKKKWYVVKVQSGREDSIKNNLERRVKIENLEAFIGRILIPIEKITSVRDGKRIEKKMKKFPGYLMCEVELTDDVKVLFRESSGVGEFVGGRLDKDPTPMPDAEVERMLLDMDSTDGKEKKAKEETEGKKKKIVLNFAVGDRVKVLQGMFKDSEADVKEIPPDAAENTKVKVVVQFWGKPVDVEVDYWHVEPV